MPIFMQSMFGRWWVMRRHHRDERDLRDALFEFNDHLLRDAGLRRPRSAGDPRQLRVHDDIRSRLGQGGRMCHEFAR
jgi:hypothetical protein